MFRVLLYGGCHARVFYDYLRGAFGDLLECSLIVNYELIASGAAFPYASLPAYDAVLFSPITNQAGYRTSDLVAACASRGIAAICFPWLEWHGYFPGAAKGQFRGRFRWYHPELVRRGDAHRGDLDAFCAATIASFPSDATIDAVLAASTDRIRDAELREGIAPVLSMAIARDYREHRLFLLPDHPTRRLYIELLDALLAQLGFSRDGLAGHGLAGHDLAGSGLAGSGLAGSGSATVDAHARLLALPTGEPQWSWCMPIFPRVASRLGLAFAGDDWVDDDIHPGATLGLRDYLAQYLGGAGGGENPGGAAAA